MCVALEKGAGSQAGFGCLLGGLRKQAVGMDVFENSSAGLASSVRGFTRGRSKAPCVVVKCCTVAGIAWLSYNYLLLLLSAGVRALNVSVRGTAP